METKLKVKMLAHTPEPDKVVAMAGKLCYSPSTIDDLEDSLTEDKIESFINRLISMGHESPIEHVTFTFAIEGVSRSLTHQLVRHRIASYSQQSQRYVKETQFEYVIPDDIKKDELLKREYIKHMSNTQMLYDRIVDELIFNYMTLPRHKELRDDLAVKAGIKPEELVTFKENKSPLLFDFADELHKAFPKFYGMLEKKAIENARYVFPNATETKIIMTMNVRSLYNFFHKRCCNRAQDEIRQLADEMLHQCKEVSPILFAKAGAPCVHSKCPEGKMSCGKPR